MLKKLVKIDKNGWTNPFPILIKWVKIDKTGWTNLLTPLGFLKN